MRYKPQLVVLLGVLGLGFAGVVARAEPPQAPKNVKAEPSTSKSSRLASSAASAQIAGDPQAALALAERAIAADPRDPWAFYDKGAALARLGKVDDALKAFSDAEGRYAPFDQWGRSIAIYGRAHALGEAKRCEEARREFARYAALIRERDAKSADMANRYAASCVSPAGAPHPYSR
jgi:tetratricopeptide (TPR) repeat protein